MTRRLLAVSLAVITLTGCAPVDMDQIMGRTEGAPIPAAPQKLDCDLIFPQPSRDTLTP
jgi:hypothetical protein